MIAEFGPSSETNGLLGRIYKDRWEKAKDEDDFETKALLQQAIAAYVQGFEADWAFAAFEKTRQLTGGATYSLTALAHTHARAGHRDEALKMLADLETVAKKKYVSHYGVAAVHVALGNFDRAFQYLDRAAQSHDRALIWLKVSPRWKSVRSDPRFLKLLKMVGAE